MEQAATAGAPEQVPAPALAGAAVAVAARTTGWAPAAVVRAMEQQMAWRSAQGPLQAAVVRVQPLWSAQGTLAWARAAVAPAAHFQPRRPEMASAPGRLPLGRQSQAVTRSPVPRRVRSAAVGWGHQ